MHKQVFDLRTRLCVATQGRPPGRLRVWPVVVRDGDVLMDLGGPR